jgi:hypothetical protein
MVATLITLSAIRGSLFIEAFEIQHAVPVGEFEARRLAMPLFLSSNCFTKLTSSWRPEPKSHLDSVKIGVFWGNRSFVIDEHGNAELDRRSGTVDSAAVQRALSPFLNGRKPEVTYEVSMRNDSHFDIVSRSRWNPRVLTKVSKNGNSKFLTTARLLHLERSGAQSNYVALDKSYSTRKVESLFRYDLSQDKRRPAFGKLRVTRQQSGKPYFERVSIRIGD